MLKTKDTITLPRAQLQARFQERLTLGAPLARYTATRIGGPADVLIVVNTVPQIVDAVSFLWERGLPFTILGGGANVLISDLGIRGVVLLNHAKQTRFSDPEAVDATVWVESGAHMSSLAKKAARKGLSGLEWAAGIPGTIGGAVFGNAGAHGSDLEHCLRSVEMFDRQSGHQIWPVEKMGFQYRSSVLKRHPGDAVVLAATLNLKPSTPDVIQHKMDDFLQYRRLTQPPGASMGSMFKNPPGDYAGRLIEAVGLKGYRVQGAEISPLHANFFVNQGNATARDVYALIKIARDKVQTQFGVDLELEVELLGQWESE